MVSLDQVKLLENKVAKTIEYVGQVLGENAALHQKEAELKAKLEAHQKRIDDLESLIARFKEDQSRIEGGILSALERLNRFEDAIEKNLGEKTAAKTANAGSSSAPQMLAVSQPVSVAQPPSAPQQAAGSQPVSAPQQQPASQAPSAAPVKAPVKKAAPRAQPSPVSQPLPAPLQSASGSPKTGDAGGEGVFFEITETESPEDGVADSLEDELLNGEDAVPPADGELDIF